MRRLDVDRERSGEGGLVGTISSDVTAPGRQIPYTVPDTARERVELSPADVEHLKKLWHFSHHGDGKQLFPLVTVPRDIFDKVASIWILDQE